MIEINLRDTLNAGQFYVAELSEKLGIEIKAVEHKEATSTCFEKAGILGWEPKRIVKAIFLHDDDNLYGFVFPELGTPDSRSKIRSKKINELFGKPSLANSVLPEGMEYGTCSPFVFEDAFDNEKIPLKKIYFHKFEDLNKKVVDISIGGFGEKAHKTSLHLKYEDIYNLLANQFGGRICEYDLVTKIL